MVSTTIRNSGGPGSPTELSPVTIAVRDKVIEKFQHEPLDQMNESVKKLLSQETDEQKRLGVLAARVYILRQRIAMLSSQEPERVVSTSSPSPENIGAAENADQDAGDEVPREWTRLKILEDCEVNGVRFPKTVIIDVKAEDAQRLIDSGNAELIEEQPQSEAAAPSENETQAAAPEAETEEVAEDAASEDANEQAVTDTAAEASDTAQQEEETIPEPTDAEDTSSSAPTEEETKETVIEAPSAAEVTAALAALSSDQESPAETSPTSTSTSEAEDVAAALEALSSDGADSSAQTESGSNADDAAAVAAELEAAAAAMSSDAASAKDANGEDTEKPGGWFEAQQKAEKAVKGDTDNNKEGEEPSDEKS